MVPEKVGLKGITREGIDYEFKTERSQVSWLVRLFY